MCTTCGCGEPNALPDHDHLRAHQQEHGHEHGHEHSHEHGHEHGHEHSHEHSHDHSHEHSHEHSHDHGRAQGNATGTGSGKTWTLRLEADVMARNDAFARENRDRFAARGVFALNLLSSPGSGKTTLLAETMRRLRAQGKPTAAVVGDQQTDHDAQRLRESGAPALQINTGKGCHLDAHQVGHAVQRLGVEDGATLFIENVGNLVCPSGFDLGENRRVVLLSVTEGEDKPLKYPDAFRGAQLLLLTKTDLLPHLDFDVPRCLAYAREIQPRLEILEVSARSGAGMDGWMSWLEAARR